MVLHEFLRYSSGNPAAGAVAPRASEEWLADPEGLGICSLGYGASCFTSFLEEQPASLCFQSLENGFGPEFISKVPESPWGDSAISTTLHLLSPLPSRRHEEGRVHTVALVPAGPGSLMLPNEQQS